jgi:hypothetical protein
MKPMILLQLTTPTKPAMPVMLKRPKPDKAKASDANKAIETNKAFEADKANKANEAD